MPHEENVSHFSAPPLIIMVLPFVLLKLLLMFEPQVTAEAVVNEHPGALVLPSNQTPIIDSAQVIYSHIATHPRGAEVSIVSLVCRTSRCEIAGTVYTEQGGAIWREVLSDMQAQPWFATNFEQSMFGAGGGLPPGMQLPPGMKLPPGFK